MNSPKVLFKNSVQYFYRVLQTYTMFEKFYDKLQQCSKGSNDRLLQCSKSSNDRLRASKNSCDRLPLVFKGSNDKLQLYNVQRTDFTVANLLYSH